MFDEHNIAYEYEPTLFVSDGLGTTTTITPKNWPVSSKIDKCTMNVQFYLPEYQIAIDFLTSGDYSSPYKKRVAKWGKIFASNHYHYITIPPEKPDIHCRYKEMSRDAYKDHILKSIEEFLKKRLYEFGIKT